MNIIILINNLASLFTLTDYSIKLLKWLNSKLIRKQKVTKYKTYNPLQYYKFRFKPRHGIYAKELTV